MIHDMDRSGYFGASDTKHIMANNRNTVTWKKFWDTKLGRVNADQIHSREIEAGNKYETPILLSINENMVLDGQIIYEKCRIRVNYDGWYDGTIYEVKTHHSEKPFEISAAYWQQCQVEMFIYQKMHKEWFLPPFKELYLVSYGLNPDEYDVPAEDIRIDTNRIIYHPVKPDKGWAKGEYMPRIRELSRALKKGKFPG